ncbi:MAG: DUF86 domain-containing protein [Bacteroidales bacterium]|nr:DUF86 domain-containing protein [Bacteroidales bacterium]
MLPNKLLKYLLDIESVISEINQVKEMYPTFHKFDNDFLALRTIERHLEIIGEAVNNIRKIDDQVKITSVKQIVNLRNLIIHSYDSVDSAILWSIIQKDIPLLQKELKELKNE